MKNETLNRIIIIINIESIEHQQQKSKNDYDDDDDNQAHCLQPKIPVYISFDSFLFLDV